MKRTVLAATAAALVLSGCTSAPQPTATPVPVSAQPTSTVTPSASRTPASGGATTTPRASGTAQASSRRPTAAPESPRTTPTGANEVPGDLGSLPAGFKLPDEDRPGDPETTPFTTTIWRAACVDDRAVAIPAAQQLRATRVKESIGPEHVLGRGLLMFPDAASAGTFMTQLRAGLQACPAQTDPDEQGYRQNQAISNADGLGDTALAIRSWTTSGASAGVPGSGIHYVAQKGAYVAIAYEGGEYVGDPVRNKELVNESRRTIEAILAQV